MKLWRKKNRVEKELPDFLQAWLVKCNLHLHRIAHFLADKTKGYSEKKKKVLLLVFIIVFTTQSALVVISSLIHPHKTSFAITRIKTVPLQEQTNQNLPINKKEFLKIQRFKSYMDSLSASSKGRKLRESLLQTRPHLMDSVNFLLNLYLKQSKTK